MPDTEDARVLAYRALYDAAEKIGLATGNAQFRAHVKAGRVRRTFRYRPPTSLERLVDAMPAVLGGDITPEQAMGLLWTYEVRKDRGLLL